MLPNHLKAPSSVLSTLDSSDGAPHQSSVTPLSASNAEKNEEQNQKSPSTPSQIRFILKGMNQALHSARADATYNHGLDPEHLLVAGAFVGKGFLGFLKNRLYYHGKSNDGTKVRPNYQLTVTLREIYLEEEKEIAKQRADNFLYIKKRLRLTKQESKFVSHHLISNHKGKGSTSEQSSPWHWPSTTIFTR